MAGTGWVGIALLIGAAIVILWLLSRGGTGQGTGGGSNQGSNQLPGGETPGGNLGWS